MSSAFPPQGCRAPLLLGENQGEGDDDQAWPVCELKPPRSGEALFPAVLGLVGFVEEARLRKLIGGEPLAPAAEYLVPKERQLIVEYGIFFLKAQYQTSKLSNVCGQCCRSPYHDGQTVADPNECSQWC